MDINQTFLVIPADLTQRPYTITAPESELKRLLDTDEVDCISHDPDTLTNYDARAFETGKPYNVPANRYILNESQRADSAEGLFGDVVITADGKDIPQRLIDYFEPVAVQRAEVANRFPDWEDNYCAEMSARDQSWLKRAIEQQQQGRGHHI